MLRPVPALSVRAGPSQLRTTEYFDRFQLQDDLGGGVVTAGAGCTQLAANSVACGLYDASSTITAKLGGGDDNYKYAAIDVPQAVDGEGGNDTIETGNGKDTVLGGPGNDDLTGGRGDDTVDGGEGNDTVDGWDGSDTVIGGPGVDKLLGDGGTLYAGGGDVLFARDGEAGTVDCGGGADRAEVDAGDVVTGCAVVERPAGASPSPGTNPGAAAPTELLLTGSVTKKQTPSALAKGKKITATLTANATCSGKIALAVSESEAGRLGLGKKALTLGTSKATAFAAGVATRVRVAVDAKYRATLAKAAKVKATVLIVCADASGRTYAGGAAITLKR